MSNQMMLTNLELCGASLKMRPSNGAIGNSGMGCMERERVKRMNSVECGEERETCVK